MIPKLRIALRIFGMLTVSLLLWIHAKTVRVLTRNNPEKRYRLICGGMSAYCRAVARIIGMSMRVTGTPPRPPFFLVSNHINFTDILILCSHCPGWFVSKAEVADWPVLGSLCRNTHTLFLDRDNRRDAQRVNQRIADLVRQGGGIVFFPEGTTSEGTAVRPFKPSLLQPAIDLGIPVHCAAIAYSTPPEAPPPSELIGWSGNTPFGTHAKTLLSTRSYTAHLHFSDQPVLAESRKQLAQDAHAHIAGLHRELTSAAEGNLNAKA
ncbi:MAG: 1-acyl-sn-glycerol-3-phosphate acyltransferase [Verrucomicrobia bacterium]|nr:1-acyl-sn-glycerol-3-phosphate acyltransferase [Verrucomicrobiota bacterium]MCH8529049.1 1-acyl-sn-glycerol-3-phosphate acyltransferase [Kiritimatiellia bacterium]